MVAAEGGQDVTTVSALLPGAFSLAYLEAGVAASDS
jgi:hypothetical protein